jgi:hypothetical protein
VRILVIDDYLNVEMALRGILDGHTVAGVRDPAALPRMLAYEEPFEAAIVDLRYVQSAATGLTALATLRSSLPAPRRSSAPPTRRRTGCSTCSRRSSSSSPGRCWPSAPTRS